MQDNAYLIRAGFVCVWNTITLTQLFFIPFSRWAHTMDTWSIDTLIVALPAACNYYYAARVYIMSKDAVKI